MYFNIFPQVNSFSFNPKAHHMTQTPQTKNHNPFRFQTQNSFEGVTGAPSLGNGIVSFGSFFCFKEWPKLKQQSCRTARRESERGLSRREWRGLRRRQGETGYMSNKETSHARKPLGWEQKPLHEKRRESWTHGCRRGLRFRGDERVGTRFERVEEARKQRRLKGEREDELERENGSLGRVSRGKYDRGLLRFSRASRFGGD